MKNIRSDNRGPGDGGSSRTASSSANFKTLHRLTPGDSGEGAIPHGALLRDAAGNLYGTTLAGGSGDGTVFKLDSTGKETILFTI